MTEVADSPVFLRPEGAQGTAGAPPCGDNDIQPLFYAMDMMVPVMALHQMDKCWVDTRPGTEGLAGVLVGVLVRGQAGDVACAAHLFRRAEAEGRGLNTEELAEWRDQPAA